MNKQTKRSIVEAVVIVVVAAVLIVKLGFLVGLGATIGAVFVYGFVSVMFKFNKVKTMALNGGRNIAKD